MNSIPTQITDQVKTPVRVFPVKGTNLDRILSDPEHRVSFHRQLKLYNPWMVTLYKIGLLPLFGMSRTVMLLTTRGRKSGKRRSTPIGYFRIGGSIHLFSAWGKATSWYKNLAACPEEVWIQIGLRQWHVQPVVIDDPDEMMRVIAQLVTETPAQAKILFGWEPGRDRLDQADFSPVIEKVLILRFIDREGNNS